jgi:PhzF family phenazine biosynthesis protein
MQLQLYQVDAFASTVFEGNPAAICLLEKWLPTSTMQQIAMENNLAETAFVVAENNQFHIRWFTPNTEVDLCGHATLAAAFVLFEIIGYTGQMIPFFSLRSGLLAVSKNEKLLTLNFPTDTLEIIEINALLLSCFNAKPYAIFKGKTDYMFVFDDENTISNLQPNLAIIQQLPVRGIIATAKGDTVDFVSRFFAPQCTSLIPYWSQQLSKTNMTAIQLSARKGFLQCAYLQERVAISGTAVLYMEATIYV